MRIIAGKAGRRRLVAPKGHDTRPTPDRVKEALFSILGPQVVDSTVLDLFAGTGALGLEALSRGAKSACFAEPDREALKALEANIQTTGLSPTEVLRLPADKAIARLAAKGRRFDLVFLDPPYALEAWNPTLAALDRAGLLLSRCLVVCEHPSHGPAPAATPAYEALDVRAFGDVSLSFFSYGKGP